MLSCYFPSFSVFFFRSNQSILKETSPGISLEGIMLKLKLQYFGHLMRRVDSSEKTLMLGGIEDRRRKGRQRMRWLDGITDSMDVHCVCVGCGSASQHMVGGQGLENLLGPRLILTLSRVLRCGYSRNVPWIVLSVPLPPRVPPPCWNVSSLPSLGVSRCV